MTIEQLEKGNFLQSQIRQSKDLISDYTKLHKKVSNSSIDDDLKNEIKKALNNALSTADALIVIKQKQFDDL